MIKRDVLLAVVFVAIGGIGGFVYAGTNKVTVCHATGSEKNPYVMVEVSANGLNGLDNEGDFIPAAGATDCTQTPPPPPPGGGN